MSAKPAASHKPAIILSLIGIALVVSYRIAVQAQGLAGIEWFLKVVAIQIPFYLAAAWISYTSRESRSLLILGLALAALFRLSIIFSPPYLSDDIYRYVWDGRVQAAGINPYRYIPADETLADLRDEKIYPNINRRDYAHTMYPPIAEAAFLLITRVSESVTWMKAVMVGFEAIAVWAIIQLLVSFGLPRQRVVVYAWHPLAVWEFAGSGHVDAMAIAFIALALLVQRKNAGAATGAMLAGAALVKLFPAVLLPAFFRPWKWKMPLVFLATVVFAYLPYLTVGPFAAFGYLPGYASERGMLSGDQFPILALARQLSNVNVPAYAYLIFASLVLGILSLWLIRKGVDEYLRSALIIAAVFMLLLAPHFSWYFVWLIPFLSFIPSISVLYMTLASFLLYLTWVGDTPNEVLVLKLLIFAPFLLIESITMWLRRKSRIRLAHG